MTKPTKSILYDLLGRWRAYKMEKAWRDVRKELLKQVDDVLIHKQNQDIYFNGHRYLYLNGQYWKDHQLSNVKEWNRLRKEIEGMEV